jgi:hypothetical protein
MGKEEDFREIFMEFGEVLSIDLRQSSFDNSAKSFALVQMGTLVCHLRIF